MRTEITASLSGTRQMKAPAVTVLEPLAKNKSTSAMPALPFQYVIMELAILTKILVGNVCFKRDSVILAAIYPRNVGWDAI